MSITAVVSKRARVVQSGDDTLFAFVVRRVAQSICEVHCHSERTVRLSTYAYDSQNIPTTRYS